MNHRQVAYNNGLLELDSFYHFFNIQIDKQQGQKVGVNSSERNGSCSNKRTRNPIDERAS